MGNAGIGRDERGEAGGVPAGKHPRGSFLSAILPAVLAVLVIAATAVALLLDRRSEGWDAAAKDLVLSAASAMEQCVRETGGSYAGCDADGLGKIEPGIDWRTGAAPVGWVDGRVGRAYADGLGESAYRLQTTSGSGQVFSYAYSGGVVTRTTHVSSSPPDWGAYPSYW